MVLRTTTNHENSRDALVESKRGYGYFLRNGLINNMRTDGYAFFYLFLLDAGGDGAAIWR